MTIEYKRDVAHLIGHVSVEDAEPLYQWLQDRPLPKVNLRKLEHLHAANLQVLMILDPKVTYWPADPDLDAWLKAALISQEQVQ